MPTTLAPTSLPRLRIGDFSMCAEPDVAREWLESLLTRLPPGPGRHYLVEPLGGAGGEAEAFVKVYNRRDKHRITRRLKSGRSMREGEGYLRFAAAGVRTPRLLFFGERRRLGLWEQGVIGTERLEAPTVVERWRAAPGCEDVLHEAACALARIHAAGLVHGDPRLRNFLVPVEREGDREDDARVIPFDLCSWAPLTPSRRRSDLVRLVGSAIALVAPNATAPPPVCRAMLDAFDPGGAASATEAILRDAVAYAHAEGEP